MKITITLSEAELRQAAIDFVAAKTASHTGLAIAPTFATFETHAADRAGETGETIAEVECVVSSR